MSDKKSSKRPPKRSPAPGPMDVDLLEQLVSLMASNDLNTVDLRDGDKRVVLKRGAPVAATQMMTYAAPPAAPMSAPRSAPLSEAPAAPIDEDAGLLPIKSPMVGTFYAKPSPDAKPFVTVGSPVAKDDTDVCVIEAMKVFNNIKSEVSGSIAKILVTDGQTVEFGTVLFLVKP